MSIIAVGYRAPEQVSVGGVASVVATEKIADQPAVNDVLATDIAASVAQAAELAVAPNVTELAISTRVKSEFQNASADDSTIAKPAIVQLSTASRNISTYDVQPGDTVQSVASRYGISADTLKWANNLTSDSLIAGATLDILPRNGIAYVVKSGDTVEKIAEKYKADVSLVTTYNDLEINGLVEGLKIIVPDGVLPNNERPGYVAPVAVNNYYSSGFVTGVGAWSGSVLNMSYFRAVDSNSGGYALGNCTAYAFYRRAQIGRPVPSQLGNAYTWATQARAFNYAVNKTPAAGAVIQAGNHVGVVEEVLPNGDLRITDMNYGYRLYNLAERIIPASTVHNYMFIH